MSSGPASRIRPGERVSRRTVDAACTRCRIASRASEPVSADQVLANRAATSAGPIAPGSSGCMSRTASATISTASSESNRLSTTPCGGVRRRQPTTVPASSATTKVGSKP